MALVIGDHTCVSDLQNSLIFIADEFLYPDIILAEVTGVALRQKFPVGGKDGQQRGPALEHSISRGFHFCVNSHRVKT